MATNIIELTVEITDYTFSSIYRNVKEFLESGYTGDIILLINSPGGNVAQGFAIVDLLNLIPNKKIGVIIGQCSSTAGLILLSCDERYMTSNSQFMYHRVSQKFKEGTYDCVQLLNSSLKGTDDARRIYEVIKSKTSIPDIDLQKMLESVKENYLNADDCLKYGVVEKVILSIFDLNIIWNIEEFVKKQNDSN